ncbi:MAG: GIY-YIG nuclease family protein [Candidatus Colwellbacteria bacterium]
MYYVYILWSLKSKIFYFGYTEDLKTRFKKHNRGLSSATAPHRPWELLFYSGFKDRKLAKDFERYLKSGSGKAFAYKRLVDGALKKDNGR